MIQVENLTVVFNARTPDERTVLKDLSLRLETGEFVSVIGSNGAGKTTLLGAIAGDVQTVTGRVVLSGVDVTKMPAERRAFFVARVFQDPLAGSCGNMTVAENLALAVSRGKSRGLLPALRKRVTAELVERISELRLGLEERLDQPMGSLSGGQRQSLSLVMATLAPSSVLLLDEHTAALDPQNAEYVLKLTRQLAAQFNLTVLMVTHSMRQALEFGTRTIMLDGGSIVLDIRDPERRGLSIEDLLQMFKDARGRELSEDRLLTG
jgi:putative ABC transport system ATP-binding protein